jgi:hypothetical protein
MATEATLNSLGLAFTEDRTVIADATGDQCILIGAGLTITGSTPAMATGRNGVWINPTSYAQQPWDDRIGNYNASLRPSFPYAASAGDSVIVARSMETADETPYSSSQPVNNNPPETYGNPTRTKIRETAVFSVMASDPAEPFIRPAPFDPASTPILISDIDETRIRNGVVSALPPIDPASVNLAGRTLALFERRFERHQSDIRSTDASMRSTHPYFQMNNYDGFIARDIIEALHMLNLDYSIEDKQPLLWSMVKMGNDLYHQHKQTDIAMHNGRRIAMMFAAHMLDDEDMAADIKQWAAEGRFYEDTVFFMGNGDGGVNNARMFLWGRVNTRANYIAKILNPSGGINGFILDPDGWIDGGFDPGGGSYDQIHGATMPSYALLCRAVMPELESLWGTGTLSAGDRMAFVGSQMLPDPQKNVAAGLAYRGVVANTGALPSTGNAVDDVFRVGDAFWVWSGSEWVELDLTEQNGIGRFPARHGLAKMGSGSAAYKSDFATSIHDLLRSTPALLAPTILPYFPTSVIQGSLELTMEPYTLNDFDGFAAEYPEFPEVDDYPFIVTGTTIRYTIDGTDPTASSLLYDPDDKPIITADDADDDGMVEIRARSFHNDYESSAVMVSRVFVASDISIPVQTASNSSGVSDVASITATFGSQPTEGNLLTASVVSRNTANGAGVEITSSGWTLLSQDNAPAGGAAATAMYYKYAGEAESTTVVGAPTGANRRLAIAVAEWPIQGAGAPVFAKNISDQDTATTAIATGTTASVPGPKVAIAHWVGSSEIGLNTGGLGYTAGYEQRESVGLNTNTVALGAIASGIIEATGTVSATATATTSTSWRGSGYILAFEIPDTTPPALDGPPEVNAAGDELTTRFTRPMNTANTNGLGLTGSGNNGGPFTLGDPAWSEGNTVLKQSISPTVNQTQRDENDDAINGVRLAYTAGNIESESGVPLAAFSNVPVINGSEQGQAFATITAQITVDGEPDLTATMPFGLFDGEITIDTSKITVSQDGEPITVTGVKQGFGLDGGGSNARIILDTDRPVYSSANGAVTITVAEGLFEDEGGNVSGPFFSEDVDNSSTQEPGPVEPPAPPAVVRRPRLTGGSAATFRVRIT